MAVRSMLLNPDWGETETCTPYAGFTAVKRGGWCMLSGQNDSMTVGFGDVIFTLPAGFRPSETVTPIAMRADGTYGVGNINATSGVVRNYAKAATNSRIDIPAVTYPVAG